MINSSPACRGESGRVLLTVHTGQLDVRWKVWRKENWRFYSTEIGRELPLCSLSRVCFTPEPRQTDAARGGTLEFTHFSVSDVCVVINSADERCQNCPLGCCLLLLRVISGQFGDPQPRRWWFRFAPKASNYTNIMLLLGVWRRFTNWVPRCENMTLEKSLFFMLGHIFWHHLSFDIKLKFIKVYV